MAEETKEATQQRIETAGLELFANRGYHAATMRQLAKAAGIRPASLYHWYPSKQALLHAIMKSFLEGLTRDAVAAMDRYSSPIDRLAAFVWTHVVYHGLHRRAAFVTDTEVRALADEGRVQILRLRDNYEQLLLIMLRDGQDRGAFVIEDVHVAAKAILLECTGVIAWFRPDGRLTLPRVADIHVGLVLASLHVDIATSVSGPLEDGFGARSHPSAGPSPVR